MFGMIVFCTADLHGILNKQEGMKNYWENTVPFQAFACNLGLLAA
jgi:hypothetical protein